MRPAGRQLDTPVIRGLAYLLTYFIAVVIDSKLKYWIKFGIYWKIYFRILGLGLGSLALAWHVSGLGIGLLALVLPLPLMAPLALLISLPKVIENSAIRNKFLLSTVTVSISCTVS